MIAVTNVHAVLKNRIVKNALLAIDGDRLAGVYAGTDIPPLAEFDEVIDGRGAFAGPGFVDLHCHAGGEAYFYGDPEAAAKHHLAGGTTSVNATIYHDIGRERAFDAIGRIAELMASGKLPNVMGVHFEGPFLSPKYGATTATARAVDPEEYRPLLARYGRIMNQWTVAPELDNVFQFIKEAAAAGVAVSIGHTEATPEQIRHAVDLGARVCTHATNASGTAISPTRYGGTIEVSAAMSCVLHDELYLEVINDRDGLHVRHDTVRLLIKAAGLERICGVTDACVGPADVSDVNLVPGVGLSGSRLRMNNAAKNFADNAGLNMCEVFRVCSLNPARAMRRDNEIGSLEPGKRADIVLTDGNYNVQGVILKGRKAL